MKEEIDWWKVATVMLLVFNLTMIAYSIVENEKQIKTHVGEFDPEVYEFVQDVLLNDYEYVQIYNTKTNETYLMHGGINGNS